MRHGGKIREIQHRKCMELGGQIMSERFDFGLVLQRILLLGGRALLDTGAGFNCHLRCWVEIDLSAFAELEMNSNS